MDKHWKNLSEALKLSDGSRERIRAQLAAQPIQQEVTSTKKKPLCLRAPLVAAALTAALVVTALAVEWTVGWENFLGRTPWEAVTPVDISAITGDYTLTLQESIVDEDGAAFLLALTRNDGGIINGDPRINGNLYRWDVEVDGERPNMSSSSYGSIRSEDGKTVYYCVEFEGQQTDHLQGKTITFLCDGIADMGWSKEEIDLVRRETVSLAPMAPAAKQLDMNYSDVREGEHKPEIQALVQELSAQAAVPLTKKGEGKAQISAILFANDGPPMAVVSNSRGPVRQGQYLISSCTALTLTDTRTGETWGCTGFDWWGDDEGFYLCDFEGCPITKDDLAYYEVTVSYGAEKVLSDEPVELSFSADAGHQDIKALDEDVDFFHYGSCSAHITEARVSALRLRLTVDEMERVSWEMDRSADNTQWALVEKDGTRVLLSSPRILQDKETGAGYIWLEGVGENDDRRLIDPDKVAALSIGGHKIPFNYTPAQ